MLRFSLFAAAIAAAVLCSCATERTDPLAHIIAHKTEARGGANAIEAINNVRSKVEITEPKFTVSGVYRAMDGAMRNDINEDDKRVYSEGVDKNGSWLQKGAGSD
ncbi:MAG: hypothetical protein R3C60_03865 [Parvularculaceae bacterium]